MTTQVKELTGASQGKHLSCSGVQNWFPVFASDLLSAHGPNSKGIS